MRTFFTFLLLISFAGLAPGQTLKKTTDKPTLVSSGAIVVPGKTFEKVVLTTEGKGEIAWDYEEAFPESRSEVCEGGKKLILFPVKAGSYRIKLILWDEKKLQQILVVITDNPDPPVPPDPKPPDPKPPDPKPPIPPVPIPEPGFRVLIVHESNEKLPVKIAAMLRSVTIREYLNQKCVKVGNQPEYRFWEQDQKGIENASSIWQAAFKRKRDAIRWIVISDGTKGYEGPLPESSEELLKLLKQYGGE